MGIHQWIPHEMDTNMELWFLSWLSVWTGNGMDSRVVHDWKYLNTLVMSETYVTSKLQSLLAATGLNVFGTYRVYPNEYR